jgi:L-lactate dehydrogenase (cytochrome)
LVPVTLASIDDYRDEARRRLPRFLFDYIDGGSYAETTLRRNTADLEAVELRQRVLGGASTPDTATMLLERPAKMPLALAPVGLAGLFARRGEVQAAEAAAEAEVPFTLSTLSVCGLAEVAAASPAPIWFQLYMVRDRGLIRELIEEARRLRCSALVLTVDIPVPGSRYRDVRSGLTGAPGLAGSIRRGVQIVRRPAWAFDVGLRGRPHGLGNIARRLDANAALSDFFAWTRANFADGLQWRDLDFVRESWDGPLAVKGLMDAEDARAAVTFGADAVVVSNHGGRQLDGVPSTIRALPAIAGAVGERVEVLVDGGVRSGLDVVRCLALGADGVLAGRAWAYALAARGGRGVGNWLALIRAEMMVAMALLGVTRVDEISRRCLADDVPSVRDL